MLNLLKYFKSQKIMVRNLKLENIFFKKEN